MESSLAFLKEAIASFWEKKGVGVGVGSGIGSINGGVTGGPGSINGGVGGVTGGHLESNSLKKHIDCFMDCVLSSDRGGPSGLGEFYSHLGRGRGPVFSLDLALNTTKSLL